MLDEQDVIKDAISSLFQNNGISEKEIVAELPNIDRKDEDVSSAITSTILWLLSRPSINSLQLEVIKCLLPYSCTKH